MERVVAVGLMAAGCGGASTRVHGDDTSDAGASSGGTMAPGGAGIGGARSGGDAGSPRGGGTARGGAAEAPQPVALGDGDSAGDGRPVVPSPSAGGFFWGGCGDAGWRLGNWFLTSDRQRDAFPRTIDPPRDTSTSARGATGTDFAAGVVLWVQLDHPSNRPVSLAGCSGMAFWARLESPSGQVVVALNDGSRGSGLLDGRAALPSRTLAVGPDWQELKLPFESFPIEGLSADGLSVASIEFFVGHGGESFDLWIDDLFLVCSSACP
ncbi:MAG TPA: hypothetical protein VJN18_11725 [Polyangiaceae bacterium]|nr:hypothetical protein [Polyangiaceae bacterium]